MTALCFGDADMEYKAIRNAALVYGLYPMVIFAINGPGVAVHLDPLTIRHAAMLCAGGVQYTVRCDDAGKILDDGTLFRHAADHYRFCRQVRHLNWLLDSAVGFDVTVVKITDPIAALALQRSCAAQMLGQAGFYVSTLMPFGISAFAFWAGR